MAGITMKSCAQADETRTPQNTTIEVLRFPGGMMARVTFQPGWRWSEHIKPVVKTDSCQVTHRGVMISGTLHIVHADGSEVDATAGNAYFIEPGHDAWVVGDQPVVSFEFESAETYAKA